jgi:hypothetical protein
MPPAFSSILNRSPARIEHSGDHVRRQRLWDQIGDLSNGGFLAHRNPNKREDEPACFILCHGAAHSHSLQHPDRPCRERKAIPAGAGFFARRIDRPPNGAAIALGEGSTPLTPPASSPPAHAARPQANPPWKG